MNSRFVLRARANHFFFSLKATNNEIVLTSERCTTKASALGAIEAMRARAAFDDSFQRRTSISGQFYFVLRADNCEVLGTSELYSSGAARDEGIIAVQVNTARAVVDDQTH